MAMLSDYFSALWTYTSGAVPQQYDSSSESSDDEPPTTMAKRAVGASPVSAPPPTPTSPTAPTSPKRGRQAKRLTSSKRILTNAPAKKLLSRQPLTPTTKTAIKKERRHKAYTKRRIVQAEEDKVLSRAATYWLVLRNGKKYRSLGGTRRE